MNEQGISGCCVRFKQERGGALIRLKPLKLNECFRKEQNGYEN